MQENKRQGVQIIKGGVNNKTKKTDWVKWAQNEWSTEGWSGSFVWSNGPDWSWSKTLQALWSRSEGPGERGCMVRHAPLGSFFNFFALLFSFSFSLPIPMVLSSKLKIKNKNRNPRSMGKSKKVSPLVWYWSGSARFVFGFVLLWLSGSVTVDLGLMLWFWFDYCGFDVVFWFCVFCWWCSGGLWLSLVVSMTGVGDFDSCFWIVVVWFCFVVLVDGVSCLCCVLMVDIFSEFVEEIFFFCCDFLCFSWCLLWWFWFLFKAL